MDRQPRLILPAAATTTSVVGAVGLVQVVTNSVLGHIPGQVSECIRIDVSFLVRADPVHEDHFALNEVERRKHQIVTGRIVQDAIPPVTLRFVVDVGERKFPQRVLEGEVPHSGVGSNF